MMQSENFKYTQNMETVFTIPVGTDDHVEVIGDQDMGTYEWVIRTPSGITQHSDSGYGIREVALRDGLIAYLGMPD